MGVNTPCMTFSKSGQPTGGWPCAEFEALRSERDALLKAREVLSNLTGNVELYIDSYLGGDQNKELRAEAQEFLGEWLRAANEVFKEARGGRHD